MPSEASIVDVLPKVMKKNGLTTREGAGWDKAVNGHSKKSVVRECRGLATRQGGEQSRFTTALAVPSCLSPWDKHFNRAEMHQPYPAVTSVTFEVMP